MLDGTFHALEVFDLAESLLKLLEAGGLGDLADLHRLGSAVLGPLDCVVEGVLDSAEGLFQVVLGNPQLLHFKVSGCSSVVPLAEVVLHGAELPLALGCELVHEVLDRGEVVALRLQLGHDELDFCETTAHALDFDVGSSSP